MKKNLFVIISFLLPLIGFIVGFYYFRNICLSGEKYFDTAGIFIFDLIRNYVIFLFFFIILLVLRLKLKKMRNVFTFLIAIWSILFVVHSVIKANNFENSLSSFARYFEFNSYQELIDIKYGESSGSNEVYKVDTLHGKEVWIVTNTCSIENSISFFHELITHKQKIVDSKVRGYQSVEKTKERYQKAINNLIKLEQKPLTRAFLTYRNKENKKSVMVDDIYFDYPHNNRILVEGEVTPTIIAEPQYEYDLYSMPRNKELNILLFVPQKLDSLEISYLKKEIISQLKMSF